MNPSENTTRCALSPAALQNVAAVESMYQFLLWLIPVLEQFPRSQNPLCSDGLSVKDPAPLQRSVSCAAAPGTTTQRTCALQTATGPPRTTVTPTRVSVSPAHPQPNFAAPRRNKSRKGFVRGATRGTHDLPALWPQRDGAAVLGCFWRDF